MSASLVPEDQVMVIFGATGDLARRSLLPALFHLHREGWLPERYGIIGNSRDEMSRDDFRAFARASVDEFSPGGARDPWGDFAPKLSYVPHEFGPGHTEPLAAAVRNAQKELATERVLFYLAVPPAAFGPITAGIGDCDLAARARVVYEKPYGADAESSRRLNRFVHQVLDEEQVYRIDHFLGKETVQNIVAMRFANGLFEPVWDRDHIDHVQIDVPETLGIGTRAGFYEATGALKDMVVTHLFQVLTFVAMEPPTSFSAKALIGEKLKVFEAMDALDPDEVVRGQYEGYTDEDGVAADSKTETFVAATVEVDNWRWAGVPFFLRTGKRMPESRSSVTLAFKRPPRRMFEGVPEDGFGFDHLTLELGPYEGVSVSFLAKAPGPSISLAPARMDFTYESFSSELIGAYERLIHDALCGDRTLFTSAAGVERAWEVVGPVLEAPPPLHPYEQGSWGPKAAEALIAPRRWHLPVAGS